MAMMRRVRRVFELPPHITLRKAWSLGIRSFRKGAARSKDTKAPTFLDPSSSSELSLARYYSPLSKTTLLDRADEIRALAALASSHRFDLLGSGWKRVQHGMRARGLWQFTPSDPAEAILVDRAGGWLQGRINKANVAAAQKIWRFIDSEHYTPIDWQLDFKSGYRWQESMWSQDIPIVAQSGADIKVPWELSRMQHLSWLVAGASLAKLDGEQGLVAEYSSEFQNQIVDFIATNPPRFGVNWCCAMDVAIRVSGWLVSYDLYRAHGLPINIEFERILARSVVEHAQHIAQNLEWDPQVRANHYLADLCGLIHAAAYLPQSCETSAWLRFSTAEFYDETEQQFFTDGANFEASTGYHRLSGEMVVYTTALLAAMTDAQRHPLRADAADLFINVATISSGDGPGFPKSKRQLWPPTASHWQRIAGIANFSEAVQGPCERAPAIGDDDSGRFLALLPQHHRYGTRQLGERFLNWKMGEDDGGRSSNRRRGNDYWLERVADHRQLVSAVAALLHASSQFTEAFPKVEPIVTARAELAAGRSLGENQCWEFSEAGFYIFRSGSLAVVMRCGSNGQNGNGGHAHNDQLAITVSLAEFPLFIDAGSYLYTPDVEIRNRFRGTAVHNTLQVGSKEQNSWRDGHEGLFRLDNSAQGRVESFDAQHIIADHYGYGARCRRELRWNQQGLEGDDSYREQASLTLGFLLAPTARVIDFAGSSVLLGCGAYQLRLSWDTLNGAVIGNVEQAYVSRSYGSIETTRRIVLRAESEKISWRLEFVK